MKTGATVDDPVRVGAHEVDDFPESELVELCFWRLHSFVVDECHDAGPDFQADDGHPEGELSI